MAPLVWGLKKHASLTPSVCVTAQHRQILDQVLNLFDIKPDIDLDLMRSDQDLFGLTSRIIIHVRDVLRNIRPDVVLVQGDTTTTFATALCAFYAGIPVGHVEAGLRTWNLNAPFPEEANRVLTSRLAAFHFCPTAKNASNLKNEGIQEGSIFVTGNTVIDALLWVREKVESLPPETWSGCLKDAEEAVIGDKPIILVTGHRRENFGQGVRNICSALNHLASNHSDWQIVYPAHPNPNISAPVRKLLEGRPNIHVIPPLDYAPFIYLMNKAHIVLTDSGGVQEEAPSLGKPVLVMRETTERQEAVEAGTVRLVGTDTQLIVEETESLMDGDEIYLEMSRAVNPYGDGRASQRIIEIIKGAGKKQI